MCLGNPLHGNDGLGKAVFDHLLEQTLPHNVDLIDGGIGGMTLLPFFRNCSRVLIIDVVKSPLPEGGVRLYKNVARLMDKNAAHKGEHGGDLSTLISMLSVYLQSPPEVDLMCVTASAVEVYKTTMDDAVNNAAGRLTEEVLTYLQLSLAR